MKIEVDKNVCIGCGSCVAIAPDNFEFDDEGLAEVKDETITEEVKTAAESCPTDAISIEE